MINTIQARVLGAMRYEMDNATKGAKLTLMNETDPDNDNRLGFDIMTISAPYSILEQLRPMAPHMPCNLEIDAEMRTSGGKMTMHAIAVRQPAGSGHPGGSTPPKSDTKPDAKAS